jgi:hypothetical protein
MKLVHRIIAVTSLAVAAMVGSFPAVAGVNDPIQLIYRASGAEHSNAVQRFTQIYCTNASDVAETFQYLVRNTAGTVLANKSFTLQSGQSALSNTIALATSDFMGYLAIGSSTNSIFCDVSLQTGVTSGQPQAMRQLHMQRYNPMPSTEE